MDQALVKLAMPEGKFALEITLLSIKGNPLPNVPIAGITTITGESVTTDANGKAFGFTTSNPVTITAKTGIYIDLATDPTQSFSLVSGIVNQRTMTIARSSIAQKLIDTSGSFYFSPEVGEYDWSAIGGGFNGSEGSGGKINSKEAGYGGSGGNAGGVINQAGITYDGSVISVIVGGIGGKSGVNDILSGNGASGGLGARIVDETSSYYRVAAAGGNTSGFLYPETQVGGAGGGGRAIIYSSGRYAIEADGGTPGGGNGSASIKTAGSDGFLPGSGGGGGCGESTWPGDTGQGSAGGSGKPGIVGFMWRYK